MKEKEKKKNALKKYLSTLIKDKRESNEGRRTELGETEESGMPDLPPIPSTSYMLVLGDEEGVLFWQREGGCCGDFTEK
jgi:hypothetical protein